jgi:hypothetical protein
MDLQILRSIDVKANGVAVVDRPAEPLLSRLRSVFSKAIYPETKLQRAFTRKEEGIGSPFVCRWRDDQFPLPVPLGQNPVHVLRLKAREIGRQK